MVTGPNDDLDDLWTRSQLAEAQVTPGGRA